VTDGKTIGAVALFVDFEHLRRHTDSAQHPVCPLSSAIEAVACRVQELGDVVTANVYADWEKLPGMQSEVKRLHLDPKFVFSNSRGPAVNLTRTNGSVISMALDVFESLSFHPEIETYVLVCDDPGIFDLVSRIRRHGREVLLVGFEQGMPEALLDADVDFEPVESYVQPADMDRQDTPPSPDDYEEPDTRFDWEPFVMLLARLESTLPFVSLKYLKNSVLTPAHGCDSTTESKAALIRKAIEQQYIETHKIPNPRNPHYATTTCLLNRRHPEVRRILEHV
jgi:NYN domain-containing protein